MSVQDRIKQLRELHKRGVVKGLKDVSGVQPRKDIDVLMAEDPDAFNIFLHAFKALKDTDPKDIMSFYQIAGIHGLPMELWDGVRGPLRSWDRHERAFRDGVSGKAIASRNAGNDKSGYCAHGVETFPTWHRPYIAMLEQSIFLKMIDLIEAAKWESADDKRRYFDASLRFRLPYWDYFRPREQRDIQFPGVVAGSMTSFTYDYRAPLILTEKNIKVRALGSDEIEDMRNPLLSFAFPEGFSKQLRAAGLREVSSVETVRYPLASGAGDDQKKIFAQRLNSTRMDLNRVMLNMLIDPGYANYDVFASNRKMEDIKLSSRAHRTTDPSGSGSIEGIHGTYHLLIGGDSDDPQGGGHMSRVPVAAFDPIFWMHHNHIERIFSLWQAIHAKDARNWFGEIPEMAKESLYPFRKAPGANYWTSDDVVSSETFGYTFSEIASARGSKENLVQSIRNMYEWSVPLPGSTQKIQAPPIMKPIDVRETQFFKTPVPAKMTTFSAMEVQTSSMMAQHKQLLVNFEEARPVVPDDGYSYEWFIDDEVERLAGNGAFTIYYFINGEPNTSGPQVENTSLLLESTLAGVTHIFAAPESACDNCANQAEQAVLVTNTNAITSMLLDYAEIGQLQSLTPEHVVPFLKERLRWRIETISGEKRDPRMMHAEKGFKLNVSLKKAQLPRGSGIAEYADYPEIILDIVGRASANVDSH